MMWRSAVDQVKGLEKEYKKNLSPIYNKLDKITFEPKTLTRKSYIKYKKLDNPLDVIDEEVYYTLEDLESW